MKDNGGLGTGISPLSISLSPYGVRRYHRTNAVSVFLLHGILHSPVSPGIQTGECIAYNNTIKTCEVFAWCPVEDDNVVPR